MVARQVRAILTSDVPRLRAVQTVAVGLPMPLLVFASVYVRPVCTICMASSFSSTRSA